MARIAKSKIKAKNWVETVLIPVCRSQNNRCFYCNKVMSMDSNADYKNPLRATIDHKIPRKHGGNNSPQNLVGACSRCNSHKGDLTENEFMAILLVNPDLTKGINYRLF